MNAEKINEVVMAIFMAMLAVVGVAEIIGFMITKMWHCLMFAGMSGIMVWVWYYSDYKSKRKKLSTLWQKKNTKH